MTTITKKLLGATAIIALAAGAATAQDQNPDKRYGPDQTIIEQVQLGNVWSDLQVNVPSSKSDTIGNVTGIANATTVTEDYGDISLLNRQDNSGEVETSLEVNVGYTEDDVFSSNGATGNSSFVAAYNGAVSEGDIIQTNHGNVTAINTTDVINAWAVSSTTTAVANTSQIESTFGDTQTFREQTADGNVFANGVVTTEHATGFVQNTAIATQNSAEAHVDYADRAFLGGIQTTEQHTTTVASAQTDVTYAQDVFTSSAASGNQFNATAIESNASVGTPGSEVFQGNGSDVFAAADTNVASFTGAASSTAAGVGNGIQFDSVGGYNQINTIQNNLGNVGTSVTLNTGDFGGNSIGIASATSIGNSVAAINQGGFVSGTTFQQNSGEVFARSQISTGRAGTVTGTASAIGNSATFNNRSSNNGRRGD